MEQITQRVKLPKRSRKHKYRDNKKKKKAAVLQVTPVNRGVEITYEVSGGSEPRTVGTRENGTYFCTCGNASSPCSHVISVEMYLTKERKQHERLNRRTA